MLFSQTNLSSITLSRLTTNSPSLPLANLAGHSLLPSRRTSGPHRIHRNRLRRERDSSVSYLCSVRAREKRKKIDPSRNRRTLRLLHLPLPPSTSRMPLPMHHRSRTTSGSPMRIPTTTRTMTTRPLILLRRRT